MEFRGDLRRQKLEFLGYRVVVCVILCLAILVEHRLVTDRQTQGHRIYRASIASHTKNQFQLSLLCECFAVIGVFKWLDTLHVHFNAMML